MTANICLTGIIINYHSNLPYVIMLNKIFIYLLVIFIYSESSYKEYAKNTRFVTFPTYYMLVRNDSMC